VEAPLSLNLSKNAKGRSKEARMGFDDHQTQQGWPKLLSGFQEPPTCHECRKTKFPRAPPIGWQFTGKIKKKPQREDQERLRKSPKEGRPS